MEEQPEPNDVPSPENMNHLAVTCPRCKIVMGMPLMFSDDAFIRIQGIEIPCVQCLATIHVPDVSISGSATIGHLDRQETKSEFVKLLRSCQSKSQLYFLLVLFGGWTVDRISDFMDEVNLLINDVLFTRMKANPPQVVPPHEALFVLQACLEAKAYYAFWRNVVSLLVGRYVSPMPWDEQKKEYRCSPKNGHVVLSTGRIVRNIVDDLRQAGFGLLASEFAHAYDGLGTLIRNAVAHASFVTPKEKNGGAWLFGEYVLQDNHIAVKEHLVPPEMLNAYFQRFLTLRLASIDAIRELQDEFRPQSFEFVAENQMKPGEMFTCNFEKGEIRFKFSGTHIW